MTNGFAHYYTPSYYLDIMVHSADVSYSRPNTQSSRSARLPRHTPTSDKLLVFLGRNRFERCQTFGRRHGLKHNYCSWNVYTEMS